jgi:hypothetical protein
VITTSNLTIDAEQVIMTLAGRKHRVVARFRLLRAGVTPDLVVHRLKAGRLRSLRRGV